MKDHRALNETKVDIYFGDVDLNVTVGAKFTKETAGHFCCKNGHVAILKKILTRNQDAAT